MVVEARFANADLVSDILKAKALQAARLNQFLRRIQNLFLCFHVT